MKRWMPWLIIAVGGAACGEAGPASPTLPQEVARDVVVQAAPRAEAGFEVEVLTCVPDVSSSELHLYYVDCAPNQNVELLVRVMNLTTGLSVERGTLVFYACRDRDGNPMPAESCEIGVGHWMRTYRHRVDETGQAGALFTLEPGSTWGWTWDYLGQGSGVARSDGLLVDATARAPE